MVYRQPECRWNFGIEGGGSVVVNPRESLGIDGPPSQPLRVTDQNNGLAPDTQSDHRLIQGDGN